MAELVERWPAAVGAAIARNARPARIARDGSLHVHTADSVWAFELGHRAAEIADRLGVPSVRFAAGPLPEPGAAESPVAQVEPSPADLAGAREIASRIGDEKLREVVQTAVSLSLARGRADAAADHPI
jgi:hypothetical protein